MAAIKKHWADVGLLLLNNMTCEERACTNKQGQTAEQMTEAALLEMQNNVEDQGMETPMHQLNLMNRLRKELADKIAPAP